MAPSKIQDEDSECSNDADGTSSAPGGLNISSAKATVAVSVNKTESHITSFSDGGDHFSGICYFYKEILSLFYFENEIGLCSIIITCLLDIYHTALMFNVI